MQATKLYPNQQSDLSFRGGVRLVRQTGESGATPLSQETQEKLSRIRVNNDIERYLKRVEEETARITQERLAKK